jgi:hypothetical protein
MAQNTAQYEALQYGREKDFDFGALAMDAVKLQKEQEAVDRKIKKEEEDFQMKMIAENPEVVHASFDNSGLQNLDAYSAKVGELMKTKANEATQQYLKDKDRMKYFTTMAKLKGEVTAYTSNIEQLVSYGSTFIEKGDDASAVMIENAKRIDAMFKTGTPGLDEKGFLTNISTIRDDDGNLISDKIKWGDAVSITQPFDKTDPYDVAKNTIESLGKNSNFIDKSGGFVISTLLSNNGELEPEALAQLKANMDITSDNEAIDKADQLDIEYTIRNGKLLNGKQLREQIFERQEEYMIADLKNKQIIDEVSFKDLDLKDKTYGLRLEELRRKQLEDKEDLPYTVSYITDEMDTSGEGKRIEYYMKDNVILSANLNDELKYNTILGERGQNITNIKVVAYKENDKYGDQVKVQYTITDENTTGRVKKGEAITKTKTIEEFVTLENRAFELNNRIRTKIGLETRSVDKDTYYNTPIFSQPPNSESGSGILD